MFGVLLIYLIPFPQFIYIICKESMHLDKDCLNINKYQRYKHKHVVKIKQKKNVLEGFSILIRLQLAMNKITGNEYLLFCFYIQT